MEELNKSISTVLREDTMRELEAIANEDFGEESGIIGLSTVIRYAVYKLISDLSGYENTDKGFKDMMDELKTIKSYTEAKDRGEDWISWKEYRYEIEAREKAGRKAEKKREKERESKRK
ncbi:MAG: hypothetical protein KAR21_11980 [Spirochaetales bacterium]|nr:hypothetical protein [Spirochaetales bacterium]